MSSGRQESAGLLPKISLALVVCSLLVYGAVGSVSIAVESARMIPAEQDVTYPEGANVYVAVLGGQTGHLYRSFTAPPYVIQPFGPLFYAVNAAVARVAALDLDGTAKLCRLIAFICYLLCGLVAFEIGKGLGFSRVESALVGTVTLAQPMFIQWNATVRPDASALLMMLLCLLFALREERAGWVACVLSGLSGGIGVLLKQSAVGALAGIAAAWLFRRKYKRVLLLALSAAVPVMVVFGILLWRGEPLVEQFTAFGKAAFSWAGAVQHLVTRGAMARLFVAFVTGALGVGRAVKSSERGQMIAWFVLANLCVGVATSLHAVGNFNYLLPAVAGCCLLLPFAMCASVGVLRAWPAASVLASAALLAGTYATLVLCRENRIPPRPAVPYERLHSLKVISDSPYIAMHGLEPELLDPHTTHEFELSGYWNPADVVAKINGGRYDLILLLSGHIVRNHRGVAFFGMPIVNSINTNYEVFCVAGGTLALKPRLREISATPEMLGPILGTCLSDEAGSSPDISIRPEDR